MSIIGNLSSSSVVSAILTRLGRKYIADNNKQFKIIKWGLADDDINYELMSVLNVNLDDPDIMSLPISEPSSNESMEMINKVWLSQVFSAQQFNNFDLGTGQHVIVTSQVGDNAYIFSNDTTSRLGFWVGTYNTMGIPAVSDNYRFDFASNVDYYSLKFSAPAYDPTSGSASNNFTQISNNSYIFNAVNADNSGKYTANSFGAPNIQFTVGFVQTPQFYADFAKPENKKSIVIPNFVTITQIDSARNPVSGVTPGTISLEIRNVGI